MFRIADYEVKSTNVNPQDLIPNNVKHIGATKLWEEGYKGEGITVGILDTGVCTTHPSLKSNLIKGKNFTDEGNEDDFEDKNGHGSNVASIVCGCPDGINPGIYGVAPNAKFLMGKVLRGNGGGNTQWVVDGLKWLIDENVDIINLSLGSSTYSKEMDDLIQLAIDKDILCCVACSNDGDGICTTNEVSYPAYLNNSISVGAIDLNDKITKFSNSNDEIDCVAPGYNINGAYLNNKFAITSGSSQASPHVAGFLALLKQKFIAERNRKPSEMDLYAQLIKHCKDLGLDYRFQGEGGVSYE